MSQTTTTPLKIAPAAAFLVTVTGHATTAWLNGAWVQLLAATGAPAAVAGLVVSAVGNAFEIDVGTGPSGAEVVFTTCRLQEGGAAFSGPYVYLLPTPIAGIASGARLAIRLRSPTPGTSTTAALLYYESLDATNASTLPAKALPAAANSVSVTPNATAWANSAYAQLTSGLGVAIAVLGAAFTQALANVEGEWDLAAGASGAEVVLTTLRFASGANANAGGMMVLNLPAPYPVAASTRLAARLRKSGTSTTAYGVALLYDESMPASVAGPRAPAYVWMPV